MNKVICGVPPADLCMIHSLSEFAQLSFSFSSSYFLFNLSVAVVLVLMSSDSGSQLSDDLENVRATPDM